MVRAVRSAVEERKQQVVRRLDHLRLSLAAKSPGHYPKEYMYKAQQRRVRELISELEAELSILNCPGEYNELPVAVVADELGLAYDQVRRLIKSGEIEARGKTAHELISRAELERIVALGVPALLRCSQQESAEIFEQAIIHLHNGDIELSERTYRRLLARESWRGPYAPAFHIGLELIKGELDKVPSTLKLIYERGDAFQITTVITYMGRLLCGMKLKETGAQALCDQLLEMADASSTNQKLIEVSKQPNRKRMEEELKQYAVYLATAIQNELRKNKFRHKYLRHERHSDDREQEFNALIQNAIYTALYAEATYDDFAESKMYVDMIKIMLPKSYRVSSLEREYELVHNKK